MMIRWRENKSNKKRERQNKTQSCRTFESWLWVQKVFVLESSRKQKHRQMSCSVHVLFLWLFKKHRTILFSSCWSFLVPESFVSVLKASQRSAADESTLYFLTSVFFSWEAVWLTAHLRLEDSRPLNEHNTTVCSSPSVTSCRWLDVLLQLEEGGGGGGCVRCASSRAERIMGKQRASLPLSTLRCTLASLRTAAKRRSGRRRSDALDQDSFSVL